MSTDFLNTASNQHALEQWAERLITKWQAKLDELGTQGTGSLRRSFRFLVEWEARSASTDQLQFLKRVQFSYQYYGKMLDYGLGRGTDFKDRFSGGRDASTNPRKRKQWISAPFYEEKKAIQQLIISQTEITTKALYINRFKSFDEVSFKERK